MVTQENILPILTITVLSYLIGSIPTAYLIGRLRNVNIFEVGSGNMGGTNVARAFGISWGVATIVLDALKGCLAVALALLLMPDARWTAFSISAIVVIVGHNWSLFATLISTAANQGKLTIRGGKGGATYFGTLLMITPAGIIVAMLALGGMLVLATRFVSLGVLTGLFIGGAALFILVAQGIMPNAILPYLLTANAIVFWRFRENIRNLLAGTERRLGERTSL